MIAEVRTRFAPSPTGHLHIGGARTALFNWLFARSRQGSFVLRIEDTDRLRSTTEYEESILAAMRWLGLHPDGETVYQSERSTLYQRSIERLLDNGQAYYCYTTPEEMASLRSAQIERGEKPRYDGRWRDSIRKPPRGIKPVVRFKTPLRGNSSYHDAVRGRITVSNEELDDLIIARSDSSPVYNLCVVVDDIDMQISHVIRGDDHINNTLRQLHLYEALGGSIPCMAHIPMVLGDDGSRLSKRHGAASILEYKQSGYLPEALLNYLVRLGWSCGDREVFSREELIERFSLDGINRSAACFDDARLDWLNALYIKQESASTLASQLQPWLPQIAHTNDPTAICELITLYQKRARTLSDLADQIAFFFTPPVGQTFDPSALDVLIVLHQRLQQLECWQGGAIFATIGEVATQMGVRVGQVGMPFRLALTGSMSTPDIGKISAALGKKITLRRLHDLLKTEGVND